MQWKRKTAAHRKHDAVRGRVYLMATELQNEAEQRGEYLPRRAALKAAWGRMRKGNGR